MATAFYVLGVFMAISWCSLESAARPSNPAAELQPESGKTLHNSVEATNQGESPNTNNILESIKRINQLLAKPHRQKTNRNDIHKHTQGDEKYVPDDDILKKLQHLMANGQVKLSMATDHRIQRPKHERSLLVDPHEIWPQMYSMPTVYPLSYAVMPSPVLYSLMTTSSHPATGDQSTHYTRQAPSVPFQIPWPLAPFFPILIKDPLLTFIQGGSFNNLFEYGQNADVCKRRSKTREEEHDSNDPKQEVERDIPSLKRTRRARVLKKRTISDHVLEQDLVPRTTKINQKVLKSKIVKKKVPVMEYEDDNDDQEVKNGAGEGDARLPFGDFGWFGNRRPVAPSPGFFINRLKVHRGGVAIAGPGGVATAGRGGTAVVGPGGLALTQPGGLAVAGPGSRVVAIGADRDMSDVVRRLQDASATAGTPPRQLDPLPDGKLVARGPVVYYNEERPISAR